MATDCGQGQLLPPLQPAGSQPQPLPWATSTEKEHLGRWESAGTSSLHSFCLQKWRAASCLKLVTLKDFLLPIPTSRGEKQDKLLWSSQSQIPTKDSSTPTHRKTVKVAHDREVQDQTATGEIGPPHCHHKLTRELHCSVNQPASGAP